MPYAVDPDLTSVAGQGRDHRLGLKSLARSHSPATVSFLSLGNAPLNVLENGLLDATHLRFYHLCEHFHPDLAD